MTLGDIKNIRGPDTNDSTIDPRAEKASPGQSTAVPEPKNQCQQILDPALSDSPSAPASSSFRSSALPPGSTPLSSSSATVFHITSLQHKVQAIPHISLTLGPFPQYDNYNWVSDTAQTSLLLPIRNYDPIACALSIPLDIGQAQDSLILPSSSFLALEKSPSSCLPFRTSATLSVGSNELSAQHSLLLAMPSFSALCASEPMSVVLHSPSSLGSSQSQSQFGHDVTTKASIQILAPDIVPSQTHSMTTSVPAMEKSAPGLSDSRMQNSLPGLESAHDVNANEDSLGTDGSHCGGQKSYETVLSPPGLPQDLLDLLNDLEHLAAQVKHLPVPRPPTVSWSDMDMFSASLIGESSAHPFISLKTDFPPRTSSLGPFLRSTSAREVLPASDVLHQASAPCDDHLTSSEMDVSTSGHDDYRYTHKQTHLTPPRRSLETTSQSRLLPLRHAPDTPRTHNSASSHHSHQDHSAIPPLVRRSLDTPNSLNPSSPRSSMDPPRTSGLKSFFRTRNSLPTGYSKTVKRAPISLDDARPHPAGITGSSGRAGQGQPGRHAVRKFLKLEGAGTEDSESFLQM